MKKGTKKKPIMNVWDYLQEGDNLEKELEAEKKLRESGAIDEDMFAGVVSLEDLLGGDDEVGYLTLENLGSFLIELKVKSRDGRTSCRRPKVYFSAHPSDFAAYFDKLTDILLNHINCDIYYLDKDEAVYDREALGQRISEMSLVIFPVTENFLAGDNRAVDCEVREAICYGVPILPVLAGGDVLAFNKEVGNFEAVDMALPDFEERLGQYLNDTLFSGAELERVRKEFAASIFLSYRKKDISYARRLIGMLKSVPSLRDVAIWYDNYLTVGEDYHEEISQALQACDLFALLATPNLVNEDNYVCRTEYPAAIKYGKTVFAAEACPTDRGALANMYRGEYPIFSADDKAGLSAFIEERLKEKLDAVQDTPEHKYYIGTAYYAGIFTDVNRELGVRLLSESAEAGYPPAAAKLIRIRRYDPDSIAADDIVRWGENAVKALTVEKVTDPALYETIADELVCQYIVGHNTKKAEKLIRQMMETVGSSPMRKAEYFEKYARLYFRLANALDMQGDAQGAEQNSDLACDYIEKLLQMDLADFPNDLYYLILGTAARIGGKRGNIQKAIGAGEKAKVRFSRDAADEGETIAYAQFAVNYVSLLFQIGKPNDALELASETEKMLLPLPSRDIVLDSLSLLYETVGNIYYTAANGDSDLLGAALHYFNKAVNTVAKMSDDNLLGKSLRFSQYCLNFGNALSQCNLSDNAITMFTNVISVCQEQAFDAEKRYLFLKTAVKNLTIELVSVHRYEEAIAQYCEFLDMADNGQLEWADAAYDCADDCFRIAYIAIHFLDDRVRALPYLEKALGYLKQITPMDEDAKELYQRIMELSHAD